MKILSVKFLLILLCIIPSFVYSQDIKTWDWATNIVGTNKNYPYSLTTDKDGNTYVAGSFSDTLKVGKEKIVSRGSFDIYLLKYTKNGNLIWAKQAGGTDSDEAYKITSDAKGNIYLTGYFSGVADFSGTKLNSKGDRDFFVAKYNLNGVLDWVKQGGGISEDYGTAINVDNLGNVIVTGIFKGAMTVKTTKYVSKGDKDIFIIKYNPDGEIVWSVTGGGNMADESTAIATNKNNDIYVCGDFEGSVEFNKKLIVSAGKKDVFLAKYNKDGIISWLKREGSASGDDHASAIALDNTGNIFLTGYFSGLSTFGNTNLTSMGSDDIFLVKYSPTGDGLWAKQTGGKGDEHAESMKLDDAGNIYLCGEFNADFTFNQDNIRNLGDWDIFVVKYSNSGEMLKGTQISGEGFDRAYGLGLDALSNIYITGFFSKAISIGDIKYTSTDADDGFIAKHAGF